MPYSRNNVHLRAIAESTRAHRELEIDTSLPIDPFLALQRSGVLVMRQPLDRLSGAYLPGDSIERTQPGVLINVNHPLSRQRYTAAHELCHHRKDSNLVFDEDAEWMARGGKDASDRERMADSFASWFLMPDKLVTSSLANLGIDIHALDSVSAYALALEMGTSYSATIRHLHTMRLIGASLRDRLLNVTPQSVKRSLVGDLLTDPRSDVQLVSPKHPNHPISISEGDLLVLNMDETPSSGYIWKAAAYPDSSMLIHDEFLPKSLPLIGGTGIRRFIFGEWIGGFHHIETALSRPWQAELVEETHRIDVAVTPKPSAGVVDPMVFVRSAA